MVAKAAVKKVSDAAAAAAAAPGLGYGGSPDQQGFKGVRMRKWGKWVSEIRLPNTRARLWLGSYATAHQAARAFDVAVVCLRGRAAPLNFPDSPPSYAPLGLPHHQIQELAAAAAATATDGFSEHAFAGSSRSDESLDEQLDSSAMSGQSEAGTNSTGSSGLSECTTSEIYSARSAEETVQDRAAQFPAFSFGDLQELCSAPDNGVLGACNGLWTDTADNWMWGHGDCCFLSASSFSPAVPPDQPWEEPQQLRLAAHHDYEEPPIPDDHEPCLLWSF